MRKPKILFTKDAKALIRVPRDGGWQLAVREVILNAPHVNSRFLEQKIKFLRNGRLFTNINKLQEYVGKYLIHSF